MDASERFNRLVCTEHLRDDLRRSSVRAAAFTWFSGFFDFLLRIGSTAILARLILPEHFGLVMMVTAVTAIADQLRDLGLSTVTVQRKEITHEEVTNLFWINVAAGSLIALLICAAAPLISIYYKEPRLIVITCLLASNFVFGGLMVQHQALLTRRLKLGYTSIVRLLSSVLSTALAVVLAWKGFGYWALVWREVFRAALLTLGMWLCFPWIPSLPFWKTNVRSLIGFGAHLSVSNILITIAAGADRFLLGRYGGSASVGLYRQAYQLFVMPVDQLLSPVYSVTQPGLSMLQNDPTRFRQFYRKVLTIACFATMPLSVFVALYATEITHVLLGKKWENSAPILVVLSFSAFIRQPVSSSAFVLVTRGGSKMFLNLTIAQIVVGVVCICVGVHWGPLGIAVADVVTTYLMLFPRLHYSLKESPFSLRHFFEAIARPVVASAITGIGLIVLRQWRPTLSLSFGLVAGCVATAILFPGAWLLMPGGKADLFGIVADIRTALQRKKAARKQPLESAATAS